jgi:hypothetical protein
MKEVRCVLFEPEELRAAVRTYLAREGMAASASEVARVEVIGSDAGVAAAVHFFPSSRVAPLKLTQAQVLSCLLNFCKETNVPLARRAIKTLERQGDLLGLMMTKDFESPDPVVDGNMVSYTDAARMLRRHIAERGKT